MRAIIDEYGDVILAGIIVFLIIGTTYTILPYLKSIVPIFIESNIG